MTDTLEIFGHEFTGVTGIVATDNNDTDKTYIRPQGTKSISANGTGIDVTEYASVDVAVQSGGGSYQSKSKTYTPSTSQQTETVYPDSGYDALSQVAITVNAMPAGNVTAPTSITDTSASKIVNASSITLYKTVTSVRPSLITPGYITINEVYSGSTTVQLSASLTTKAAATITPGTTDQTIAKDTYLTGVQTISGDANLVASNIISGKSIFGVAGSVSFITYYTGSSTPASSLGSNGDIYLKTS